MNEKRLTHPGRSVDFLSRLHDGELPQAERVRFEAHRAHCAECRRAAIEFEDAISLFRSTRSTPPRSDLAARILRKVQSTNRPRAPFSPRFRIDLGWAALLLTALFAVLISTPLLVRQRVVSPSSPPSAARQPEPQVAPNSPAQRPAVSRRKAPLADSRAASLEERKKAPLVTGEAAAPAKEEGVPQIRERTDAAGARREMPRAAASAPEPASAGGEGDVALRDASAAAPLHLSISEVDGFGAPPALVSKIRIDLPASERGREYVLIVDSQGRVRHVSRPSSGESDRIAAPPPPLSQLRFEPGNRPRRLLVRID
jgi:hypothetical protein